MKTKYLFNLLFIVILTSCVRNKTDDDKAFHTLNTSPQWSLTLDDDGTNDWRRNWFLDGERASVTNSSEGMTFAAGDELGNDACHAVLWTNVTFEGDLKVEYDFTREDDAVQCVNIIYFQATGTGDAPYTFDITQWNDLRIVPHMRTYFKHMDALHVSYSAFPMKNTDCDNDYIRVRRYPVHEGDDFNTSTEVKPAFFRTGFFAKGVKHHITYLKTDDILYMKVENTHGAELYKWNLSDYPHLKNGRVGLRHMYTRSSTYKNFKVYQSKNK